MTPPRAKDGAGSPSRAGEGGRRRGRSPLALPAEIDAWCLGASWPWPPKPFRRSLRCFLSAPLFSNLHPLVVSSPLPDRDRPTEDASWHQDVSRRTPEGAMQCRGSPIADDADGERGREREGLPHALVRKRARLPEQNT